MTDMLEPATAVALSSPLRARDLLRVFGAVQGPDVRRPNPARPYGTLALKNQPVYRSVREARCDASREAPLCGRDDATPHGATGITTLWFANAPPLAAGA